MIHIPFDPPVQMKDMRARRNHRKVWLKMRTQTTSTSDYDIYRVHFYYFVPMQRMVCLNAVPGTEPTDDAFTWMPISSTTIPSSTSKTEKAMDASVGFIEYNPRLSPTVFQMVSLHLTSRRKSRGDRFTVDSCMLQGHGKRPQRHHLYYGCQPRVSFHRKN